MTWAVAVALAAPSAVASLAGDAAAPRGAPAMLAPEVAASAASAPAVSPPEPAAVPALASWPVPMVLDLWDYPRWLVPGEKIDRFRFIRARLAAFEAAHPGTRVRLTELTWNRGGEKLKIAALGGVPPDVAPGTLPLDFIGEDLIEPIDDYLSDDDRADYLPAALRAFTLKGRIWGWPWYMSGQLLFVHRDLVASATAWHLLTTPVSLQEALEAATLARAVAAASAATPPADPDAVLAAGWDGEPLPVLAERLGIAGAALGRLSPDDRAAALGRLLASEPALAAALVAWMNVVLPPDGRWSQGRFIATLRLVQRWQAGRPGHFPLGVYFQKNQTAALPFLQVAGGEWLAPDASGTLRWAANRPEMLEGFAWFERLMADGLAPPDSGGRPPDQVWPDFAQTHRFAVAPFGMWAVRPLQTKFPMNAVIMHYPFADPRAPATDGLGAGSGPGSGVGDEAVPVPIPGMPAAASGTGRAALVSGGARSAAEAAAPAAVPAGAANPLNPAYVAVSGYFVFRQADPQRRAAAMALARWLTAPATQRELHHYSQFPTRQCVGDIYVSDALMSQAARVVAEGRTTPPEPRWPQCDEEIQSAIQTVLTGRDPATRVLPAAGGRVDALLARQSVSARKDLVEGSFIGRLFLLLLPVAVVVAIASRQVHLLFLLPAGLVIGLFLGYPLVDAVILAFREYRLDALGEGLTLGNFRRALAEPRFIAACKNTGWYCLLVVPANVATGLVVASLISSLSGRAKWFFRLAYYLPGVASVVVLSMVWKWLFHGQTGLFNTVLRACGGAGVGWLTDPSVAFWSVVLTGIIRSPGGYMLIYLAAIANLPASLYEVADLEGATPLQKWWHITVPLLAPTTAFLLITGTIDALQVFAQVLMLTDGGPADSTVVVVHRVYTAAFRDFDFGGASAMALLLFAAILAFTLVQRVYGHREVEV